MGGKRTNSRTGVIAGTIILAMTSSGCTTMLSSAPEPAAYLTPTSGIPYRLPLSQFTITVSWTLTKCASGLPGSDATPEFDVSATHTSAIVEGEMRTINYQKLTKPFKTGEIKAEYHEGTLLLKSINATITGKEPEALTAALKLGLNVARIGIGLPVPGSGGAAPGTKGEVLLCPQTVADMITEMDRAKARVKAIPDEAQKLEDQLVVLRLRIASGTISAADRKKFNVLQKQADALAEELVTIKKVLDRIKTRLTYSEEWKLPSNSARDDKPKLYTADPTKLKKWLEAVLGDEVANDAKPEHFNFFFSLTPVMTDALCPAAGCPSVSSQPGIVFRVPVEASLLVTATGAAKPLISETVKVAQFGRPRVLPLRSDWGENNTLAATFAKDGLPTSISYKSTEAPGVKTFEIANDAAGGVLGLIEAGKAQRDAEEKEAAAEIVADRKAQLDELTRQISMLENQVKLAKLQGPGSPEVDALAAELAVLRLQKEKSDLEAAIKKNETP